MNASSKPMLVVYTHDQCQSEHEKINLLPSQLSLLCPKQWIGTILKSDKMEANTWKMLKNIFISLFTIEINTIWQAS